ncbi:MAG: ribosomal protein [Verrucomicrobiota bacterium]|jgi:small subunit ribosomal protein S6
MSKYRYEGLLILNVKGKEDGAQKIIDRIEKDFKAEGCEVESVQKMDTRHFSYVAGDLDSGFYVNFVFKAAPASLDKLKAKFKLDGDVYRQQYGRLAAKAKAA